MIKAKGLRSRNLVVASMKERCGTCLVKNVIKNFTNDWLVEVELGLRPYLQHLRSRPVISLSRLNHSLADCFGGNEWLAFRSHVTFPLKQPIF